MTLLSVLRNGDHRFLPLLLSKVHDVLPRLVNPMLQTVPDPPANAMCDVDIFDGFGNAGIGVASQFPGYNGDGTSGFKIENDNDFGSRPHPEIPAYDKRIEDLSSPVGSSENAGNTPYTSPPILQSPMEFPGLSDYGSFQDLSSPQPLGNNNNMSQYNHNSNFGEGIGGGGMLRNPEFKREFTNTMQLLQRTGHGSGIMRNGMDARRPPIRQNSGSSYGMMPRSIPDQNPYQHLQRIDSGNDGVGMGMGMGMGMGSQGDMSFR